MADEGVETILFNVKARMIASAELRKTTYQSQSKFDAALSIFGVCNDECFADIGDDPSVSCVFPHFLIFLPINNFE